MKNKINFVFGFIIGAAIFGSTVYATTGVIATLSTSRIIIEGKEITSPAYIINGEEYVRLEDLAEALNLNVTVIEASKQVPKITSNHILYENELEVIRLVNEERAKAGLKPVTINPELCRVARIKAQEMSDLRYFAHNSPTYGSPSNMIRSFDIKYKEAGECLGRQGGTVPDGVMWNWMHSPGHKMTILNSSYTEAGIGLAEDGKGLGYWSLMMIN